MDSAAPKHLGVLVALNWLMAGLCALALLMLGLFLTMGVYSDIQEGADDTIYGVIGVLFMALPFLVGFPLCLTAAVGLQRRTAWGYMCHIAGTIAAALTCIGAVYTVIGLVLALNRDFRAEYPAAR